METTDVYVAVARDVVGKALLKRLHVLGRCEDCRDSTGDRRVALEKCIKVSIRRASDGEEALGVMDATSSNNLLRGWSCIRRSL